LHSDYHKPSDTWEKINADDAVKLLGEIDEIALTLADAACRPVFARAQPPDVLNGEIPRGSATSGYGPYFGSIPDFGGPAKGVRFSEYRPMGTGVIAICDRFRPRDFAAARESPAHLRASFAGFFGSLETVNEFLHSPEARKLRPTPAHLL
jgi:hypothetical protein